MGGPRAGYQGNPAAMRRFMTGDNEGMILRMLAGDPRTAQELGLSEAQVKEIKESMASSDKEMTELNGKLEQAAMRQGELWKADTLDEEAILKAVGDTDEIRSQVAKMRAKQALAALKVLTPEQRTKLRATIKQRMEQPSPWLQPGAVRNRQPGADQGRVMPQGAPLNPQPSMTPAVTPPPVPTTPPAAK